MSRIRVLLVDDEPLICEGVRNILLDAADIQVVGEAYSSEQAVALALQLRPDVVLLDIKMHKQDGLVAAWRLQSDLPQCRVILLTTFLNDQYIFEGLRAGIAGYLLKNVPAQRISEAIREAMQGGVVLDSSVAAQVAATFRFGPVQAHHDVNLSPREQQVLHLVARGFSNRTIADMLTLSEGTVKNHLTKILGKLGVRDRVQAVQHARSIGLL
ncbi:MAG TPA: response regulator transcription factor [Herpetosiphonaceae bacterium]